MNYIIWANIYLAFFYGFYWFFMRKETFFELNRYYLMVSILLSFIIPALDLKDYFSKSESKLFSVNFDFEAQVNQVIVGVEQNNPSWFDSISALPILVLLYLAGCLFFFIKLVVQIIMINKGLNEANHGEAYSFFHHIHVDSAIENYPKILEHERVHANQFHSLDILVIEVVKVFNWFNPIVYMMGRSAKLNHEYIADEYIINNDEERILYAESLLSKAFESQNYSLKNNFIYESFIKNRIMMLFKNKSRKAVLSRFLLLIPVLFVLISFQNKPSDFMNKTLENPILAIDLLEDSFKEGVVQPNDTTLVDELLFVAVEIPPAPMAGMAYFLKGIAKDYRVSEAMVASRSFGRLIITFVVEKNGTLSDFKVVRDLGSGTAEEAIRVLKNSPKWNPGIQNGRPVRVQYTLPIMINEPSTEGAANSSTFDKSEVTQSHPINVGNSSSELIEESIDIAPIPPGGIQSFLKFIGRTYQYPAGAEAAKVQDRVIVTFVVEKDGNLTDVKLVKDLGYGTGEEAIRVIRKSEKWEPGYNNGKAVRVQYTLPIVLATATM